MRPPLANTTAQKGCGFSKITFTVYGSIFSTFETSRNPGRVEAAVPGSRANCSVKTTSSAVKACHRASDVLLSFHSTQRTVLRDAAVLSVGSSSRARGRRCVAHGAARARRRGRGGQVPEPTPEVGMQHGRRIPHEDLRSRPRRAAWVRRPAGPGRGAGLGAAGGQAWAASGAVTQREHGLHLNCRRLTTPRRTCPMSSRSASSIILVSFLLGRSRAGPGGVGPSAIARRGRGVSGSSWLPRPGAKRPPWASTTRAPRRWAPAQLPQAPAPDLGRGRRARR